MSRRLLCLPLLFVPLAPTVAGAAEAPNRSRLAVQLTPEVVKLLGQRIKTSLLNENEGQSAEVRLFATLTDSRLVVARKSMNVETQHWRSNRFGEVRLISNVPCEAFFALDTSQIVCTYYPASKTLKVRWPGCDILTITPDMTEQRKEIKTTGMRFQSTNGGVLRELADEVPDAVRRISRHEFQKCLPGIEEETRSALRELFEDIVRPIDPMIRVQVEPAP
jgi:hypothetical protein